MSITFSYEITRVDEEFKCMDVTYSADGYETLFIGVRLPFDGEQLEDVIRDYAPLSYWEESKKKVVVPSLGSGTLEPIVEPEQISEETIAQQTLMESTGS